MTTYDQKVVNNGQPKGLVENWTSDQSIDAKWPDKFIYVVFEYDILRLLMTINDQKVVKSGQTQGFIENELPTHQSIANYLISSSVDF